MSNGLNLLIIQLETALTPLLKCEVYSEALIRQLVEHGNQIRAEFELIIFWKPFGTKLS